MEAALSGILRVSRFARECDQIYGLTQATTGSQAQGKISGRPHPHFCCSQSKLALGQGRRSVAVSRPAMTIDRLLAVSAACARYLTKPTEQLVGRFRPQP